MLGCKPWFEQRLAGYWPKVHRILWPPLLIRSRDIYNLQGYGQARGGVEDTINFTSERRGTITIRSVKDTITLVPPTDTWLAKRCDAQVTHKGFHKNLLGTFNSLGSNDT